MLERVTTFEESKSVFMFHLYVKILGFPHHSGTFYLFLCIFVYVSLYICCFYRGSYVRLVV